MTYAIDYRSNVNNECLIMFNSNVPQLLSWFSDSVRFHWCITYTDVELFFFFFLIFRQSLVEGFDIDIFIDIADFLAYKSRKNRFINCYTT